MHKRSRKMKSQIFLLGAAFTAVFFVSFLIHSDGTSTSRLDWTSTRTRNGAFPTYYAAANNTTSYPLILNDSDWSSACATTTRKSSESHRIWGEDSLRMRISAVREKSSCDLFSGKWVYDNESHPLYDEGGCPYMSDQLACRKHGRPDMDYQKWRWKPHNCSLKRWNATEMLEKLRNKRLMFVGDSLNRGQWISMVCLLQSVIPNGKKSMSPNAELTIFKANDYNATVEFYWAPLLVESNSDDPVNHRLEHRIIRPDSIVKHTSQWEGADILVFNTYLWWRSGSMIKLLGQEHGVCFEEQGAEAMKLALNTWAEWVSSSSSSSSEEIKKQIFYVTMSPTHLWSWEWDSAGKEGNCYGEKAPIEKEGYWGTGSDLSTMRMVDDVLNKLGSKVSVLNITQLSEYRKDGHPSTYRKFWEIFSQKQLANPTSYADCIHWCLPGVPDTWNELLYQHLL
ncbi:Protein trichome birefringence-like 35 [Zostera marina]|uniref:Protein trichome birefringence-like 35 n=1 Tax=Zostera marina TaxID=29655 RepID=A0A0K9PUF0_ZOSMR|nr:Protein trichome birefringence-like 35 [Zostera marina]